MLRLKNEFFVENMLEFDTSCCAGETHRGASLQKTMHYEGIEDI
jgi:hypothetical protein